MRSIIVAAVALTAAACGQPAEDKAQTAASAPAASEPPVAAPVTPPPVVDASRWLGRWNGPEGLFLDIKAGDQPGTVAMTLKDNLDTQADYLGRLDGDVIRFERRGAPESIRFGTGAETGFKYLQDRQDCVIVIAGQEGYCRPA
ncbi:MAG: hypothetical protein ABW063_05380 [Caulobacter sp.]